MAKVRGKKDRLTVRLRKSGVRIQESEEKVVKVNIGFQNLKSKRMTNQRASDAM